jgi:hypothetical protein
MVSLLVTDTRELSNLPVSMFQSKPIVGGDPSCGQIRQASQMHTSRKKELSCILLADLHLQIVMYHMQISR